MSKQTSDYLTVNWAKSWDGTVQGLGRLAVSNLHGGLLEEVIGELLMKMRRRYLERKGCKRIPSSENSSCKGSEVGGNPAL